jgi:hypothetical protein
MGPADRLDKPKKEIDEEGLPLVYGTRSDQMLEQKERFLNKRWGIL